MSDDRKADGGSWHALRVRSRHERILDRELSEVSIRSFAPVVQEKREYAGTTAVVLVPLIPGYVFVEGSLSDIQRAIATGRVISFSSIDEKSPFAAELHELRQAMSTSDLTGTWTAWRERIMNWLAADSGPVDSLQGEATRGIAN